MRTTSALLALLLTAAAPLAAQSNAERMANDQYTRSHDYDLIHQRIELRDFDWDSLSFQGRVATTLVALRPVFDSVILDAGKLLDVKRVTDRAGELRTGRQGDTLVVYLRKPAGFGDTVRFDIAYGGKVENGRGLTFIKADGRPHRPQQIWSQGEDDNNHDWFPTYDFPNDKMTWEMVVTVPATYTAVSNGTLAGDVRRADGTRTMTWRQDKPSTTYLVSLIVAPLVRIRDAWRGLPVDYYVYREDSALARPLFKVTPDMIEVYSRLTGVLYPWAKYAQTTVADFFGGMENVSATTLVDWLPDERAYLDRPWYPYILIPHELAHQWFGDLVTTEDWANMWLNEGFAEYLPGQYWREKLGAHAEDDYYLDEYRQFMQIDRRRRMPLAALGSNNIYPRGALVLRMLERYTGRERFWAAIHEYLTTHAYDNATTDDLRQAFLEATGENLSWFWDQWVYQAGYPEFTVAAQYDSTTRSLALNVKQTQVDTATADSSGLRYVTPQVFRMPVTVRVGTDGKDVVHREWLSQREQTIRIDGVASAPTMVIFDDGNTILKKLTFEQPTAWLAAQLEQDPDLWNRNWVIEQLGKRTDDPAAAAALAGAATRADYYLTRVQAAQALGGFPATVALSPLESALKDTSAAVRVAAVTALGQLGGARARELAQDRFRNDRSYQVQAAAVTALVRMKADGVQPLLAQAMATPSYRDVIQQAAFFGIAQTGDTSMVDQLSARLGEHQFAALVLGVLTRSGSGRALDTLTTHLNDERPYVRGWVLGAFRQTVPDSIGKPRLETVKGELKYEDTRRGVERILGAKGKP
ncbi:MAG: M1 family aminopeptidase [Gemmatimonadales bacterium]